MSEMIPITEAAEKYRIPLKKLMGHILRNNLEDPIGGLDEDAAFVYTDWRLEKLAKQCADNSPAVRP